MIFLLSFLLQIGQQCTFSCDTCSNDSSCLSCNPTRNLVNNTCQCINSFMEVGGNHCFQCSSSCGKCDLLDQSSCVDCGDQAVYHRVLNSNNQCVCQDNYQEVWFSFACFDTSFSSQMYSFQYILQQQYYINRLQQKYNYSSTTISGMQYLLSQGLVTNTSESTKQYEKISLIKTQVLYKMSLPNFPTGQYYAELHNNTFMLGILLDPNQNLYWAANANTMDYKGYPSSRNNTWNIYIFQLKLVNFPTELFLQVAISQKDNVASSGSRLLSETNTNFTFAYYLGYTQDQWFTNAELEDIINDIMYILIEKPANSDEYYYNGTDTIITTCKTNYKLIDGICVCQFTLYNGECYPNCPSGCKTCTEEVCVLSDGSIICRDGYYMDQTLKICVLCSNKCLTCNSYDSCIICQPGLIPLEDKCLTCEEYHKEYKPCVTFDDHCECIECIDGYKLNGQICIPCPVNCTTCQFDDICQQCSKGYHLKDGKCVKCVNNCLKCDSENECTSCDLGYYIDTGLVYKCDNSCKSYGENCICKDCPDQYYLSSEDQLCYDCISPCKTCTTKDVCITCVSEDYYFDEEQKTCPLCKSPCLKCESETKCIICIDGYFLSDSYECDKCLSPMLKCEKKDKCISCIPGYQCFQGQCQGFIYYQLLECPHDCSATCYYDEALKYTQCDDCVKGYYKNKTTVPFLCDPCPNRCSDCLSQSQCLKCKPGYILIDGICKDCSELYNKNCISCNETECLKCQAPYQLQNKDCVYVAAVEVPTCSKNYKFYNKQTNTCDDCLKTCLSCEDSSTCTGCPDGYYLERNLCVLCHSPCKTCSSSTICIIAYDGYYIGDSNGTTNTFICVSPCYTCSSSLDCISCDDGYYYLDGRCPQCDSNCKGCKEQSTTCTSCPKGYLLVKDKCEQCIDSNCQSCNAYCSTCNHLLDALYQCFECITGYYEVEQEECVACDVSCKTCIQTAKQCTSCPDKYYLTSDSICLPCDTGCSRCQIETKSCMVCDDGLQLVENSNYFYSCIKCGTGCQECDATHCIKCLSSNYYLTELGQCQLCVSPCKTCSSKSQCITCVDQYFFDGQTCLSCSDGCQQCTSVDDCQICKVGYYLEENECKVCPDNCVSCTSNSECGGCRSGYYLDHLCYQCSDHCLACTKDECKNCETPYTLEQGICTQDTVVVCIANCEQCTNSTECVVCNDSYALTNTKQCDIITVNQVEQESSSSSGLIVIIGIAGATIPLAVLAKYTYDRCKYDIRPRKPERRKQRLQDLIQTEPSLSVV